MRLFENVEPKTTVTRSVRITISNKHNNNNNINNNNSKEPLTSSCNDRCKYLLEYKKVKGKSNLTALLPSKQCNFLTRKKFIT